MEVSSDRPWEEGSNGHHVAASRGGFPETRHHHPASPHGSSSLSPALAGSGCPPSLPGLPCPLPTPNPTPGFPALAFGAALLVLCFLASVHFNHQLCLCVSYCMVAKILGPHHLRQLQLQSVASFGEETLKFSKTV